MDTKHSQRIKVYNMQSFDWNRESPDPKLGIKLLCPDGGSNQVATYLGQLLHLYYPR